MRHTNPTTTTTTPKSTSYVMAANSMESLQLPADLYWDGKSEPNTPPASELFSTVDYNIAENWIDEDDIANEIIDKEHLQTIEEACELIVGDELIMEIINLKEENWTNVKPQTPTTNYVDEYMVDFTQVNPLSKVVFQNSLDGLTGLQGITNLGVEEFCTPVVNNLDNAILTQLTPPQSPPLNNINIINNTQQFFSPDSQFEQPQVQPQQLAQPTATLLQPQQQQSTFIWSQCNNNNSIAASIPTLQTTDNYLQTQIIDEIVNSRAQELSDWNDEFEALSTSSISSLAASFNADGSATTDEDWLLNSSSSSSGSASPSYANNEKQQEQQDIAKTSDNNLNQTKKRRPYGRAIEDRKIRKKEQNKNAATRYRQKKKLEMEVVLSEEHNLLQRNEELKRELSERRKEAKYLKTLLREFHEKQQQLKQKS